MKHPRQPCEARNHREYLSTLERRAEVADASHYELWAASSIGFDIQSRLKDRMPWNDEDPTREGSRPHTILKFLKDASNIDTLLDIGCGDALILSHIKAAHPGIKCYGVDLHAGEFPNHKQARLKGIKLYRCFMQQIFEEQAPAPFDVVLFLNMFHGWEWAGLRRTESDLARQAIRWFRRNAYATVVTAHPHQMEALEAAGLKVTDIGPGESGSRMVVVEVK